MKNPIGIGLAVIIGLIGLRLLSTGMRTFIMMFKAEDVPLKARQRIFRDLFLGILLIILAIVIMI
ncbi:MAG: hypothetical protein AAF629_33295 [Chloroflexota bacterium]